MNKLRKLALPIMAALAVVFSVGCATPSSSQCDPKVLTPEEYAACVAAQRQKNLETWAARLKVLASEGIPLAYAQLPEDKKDNFLDAVKKVKAGLSTLQGPTVTLDQVVKVVKDAGINQLADKDAQMYIASGKLLLSFVGVELSVEKPAEVELFRAALESGFTDGLAAIQ